MNCLRNSDSDQHGKPRQTGVQWSQRSPHHGAAPGPAWQHPPAIWGQAGPSWGSDCHEAGAGHDGQTGSATADSGPWTTVLSCTGPATFR